jgi:hypothetical protein
VDGSFSRDYSSKLINRGKSGNISRATCESDNRCFKSALLFDRNATQLIDFESLAVLVTLFVQSLTGMNSEENLTA